MSDVALESLRNQVEEIVKDALKQGTRDARKRAALAADVASDLATYWALEAAGDEQAAKNRRICELTLMTIAARQSAATKVQIRETLYAIMRTGVAVVKAGVLA